MSRLEELIQILCPNGVEYVSLGEFASINKGEQLNLTKMTDDAPYPVMNGGVSPSGKYHEFNTEENTITVSQGGASAGYVNFLLTKFWAGAHCYVVKPKNERVNNKYLFYFIKNSETKIQGAKYGAGIPGLNKSTLENLSFPLPPLTVQEEIVRILDTFSGVVTELEQKLEAEQAARTKQYEHYRDELFDFVDDDIVSYVPLESVILTLKTGLNPRKNFQLNTADAKNHYVTVRELAGKDIRIFDKTDKVNDEALRLINNRSNLEVNDILFSGTGTVGRTAIVQNPPTNWNIKEGVYVIKPDRRKINPVYLLYLLQSGVIIKKYEGKIVGSPVISLPMYELRNLIIPVPSLEFQEEIVSILDCFDTLVNDLKSGLPAEIALRRKQYEYYRDKLLTFTRRA